MDKRFIAALTAGFATLMVIVAMVALALIHFAPDNLAKLPPNVPVLVESRVTNPAPPLLSPADTPFPNPSGPGTASLGGASVVTGSVSSSNQADAVAPRRPPQTGSNEIIRNRLGQAAESPLSASNPKTDHAALPQDGVGNPGQPASSPPGAQGPLPGRPVPDRRYDGVFTEKEIGSMKAALRLTPDQIRYWPPVEAQLREIGIQQMALVQAGRQPKEAFGTGVSMRMYWAARPLLGVLREDQKAEIRKRARAMGFEAVASSI